MSKVAHYLQEHLLGEVMTSTDARRYFATDSSIFTLPPSIIVYPRDERDIRKTARFSWQLAERGRVIPITARGWGTDMTGAALGDGILLVFPAHMNRIVMLEQKSGIVVAEPGLNYGRLQQTLQTHERFLPPYPASLEFSTLGGAVANNAAGEKSVKYGVTRDYVKTLRVVLANGEVIETGRLSRREVGKKMGLNTFEGEIYRALDTLIEENKKIIETTVKDVTKNAAGYNIFDVRRHDGSFDLTPLIVGSQGTLGIVSEITCETEAFNPETVVFAAFFDSVSAACDTVEALRESPQMPSAIELVDGHLLKAVHELNPNQLSKVVPKPLPAAILVVELDTPNDRHRRKTVKYIRQLFAKHATDFKEEAEPLRQAELWKIRHASATLLAHSSNQLKPLPLIEDAVVPVPKLHELIAGAYQLFAKYSLDVAVWGHAGDGNIHVQPFIDIAQLGDRQRAFRIMDEYYTLVIGLGGSTTGQHNDGRLRGPYLQKLYGPEVYEVFQKIKQIFDPHNILNPGVKIGVTTDDIKPIIRSHYSLEHLYQHMPRS